MKLRYGSAPSQFVLVHRPAQTATDALLPTVVLVHGGFWKAKYGVDPPSAAIESIAQALLTRGLLVAQIEYRRDGDEQWGPGYTDNDVLIAYTAILSLSDVDTSRVVLLGHSAGATLALSLLLQNAPPPAMLIAVAPVADLCDAAARRFSDQGDAVQRYMHDVAYETVCPACRISQLVTCDIAVISGSKDEDVPADYANAFYKKLSNAFRASKFRCELVHLQGADHYDLVNAYSNAWPEIMHRIAGVLRLNSAASYNGSTSVSK